MTKIRIAADLTLDLPKLIDSRMLINANSGGGKSYLLRLIAERACPHIQTIILDPEGEFVTLREKFDFILAGEGGEIPCEVRSAALLARKLIELSASAVIDLYDLKLPDRRRFVRLFLESMMHLPKTLWHPTLIMLDEAHLFCPERSAGEAESTQAVIDLMSQGRKRSYCGILATQRLSKLHKDAEAETNNVAIGKCWLDLDQERAGKLLGMKDRSVLRDLPAGTFYAFGPALSTEGVCQFKAEEVSTTHPRAGQRHRLIAPKPSDAVKAIVGELADLPQQAEAEIHNLNEARIEISELRKNLRQMAKDMADCPTFEVEKIVEKRIEVPVLKNGQLIKTARFADRTEALGKQMIEEGQKLMAASAHLGTLIMPAFMAASVPVPAPAPPRPTAPAPTPRPRPVPAAVAATVSQPGGSDGSVKQLGKCERAILTALAQYPQGRMVNQIAVLSGYTENGLKNSLSTLRSAGFITRGQPAIITGVGLLTLGEWTPLPTGDALAQHWLWKLGKCSRAILETLLTNPDGLTPEQVAERTGYTVNGLKNSLSELRTLELITRGQPIRPSEHLFQ